MKPASTFLCCSLLSLFLACGSIKKPTAKVNGKNLKVSEVQVPGDKTRYDVKSFDVVPLQRKVNYSLFNPRAGVRYSVEHDLYIYGADIEYDITFEIRPDSANPGYHYTLDGISVRTKKDHRNILHGDAFATDSIFILPGFKAVKDKGEVQRSQTGKIRLSHRSSSENTHIVFQLKDKGKVVKTAFAKPMVREGRGMYDVRYTMYDV